MENNDKPILAPSLLSADFGNLSGAIHKIEERGGKAVHIDVMDGIFVPHISYGEPVVQSIRQYTNLPFDVHLMVEKPESHIDSFAKAGADWITFHIESTVHAHRHLEHIKSLGKKAGISLVPSTPVSIIEEVLPLVDIVLVMTVNPGFGGQKLITSCVNKIRYLKRLKNEKNFSYKISVDGGINENTYKSAIEAGADILVSGSAFFADKMPSF